MVFQCIGADVVSSGKGLALGLLKEGLLGSGIIMH